MYGFKLVVLLTIQAEHLFAVADLCPTVDIGKGIAYTNSAVLKEKEGCDRGLITGLLFLFTERDVYLIAV